MRKYLFLAISILSIFFITEDVKALTFDVNGTDVEVTEENLIYYCYSLHPNILDYDNVIVYYDNFKTYNCFAFNSDANGYNLEQNKSTTSYWVYGVSPGAMYQFDTSFNPGSGWDSYNFSSMYFVMTKILNSNFNIYKMTHSDTLSFSSNITKQEIIDYFNVKNIYTITYYVNNEVYQTIEVEEGSSHELLTYAFDKNTHTFSGWQYDEAIDLTNITSDITITATLEEKDVIPVFIEFPINKTEFYALLVEVGLLIMIIFLKWCFPFKGGSDLR